MRHVVLFFAWSFFGLISVMATPLDAQDDADGDTASSQTSVASAATGVKKGGSKRSERNNRNPFFDDGGLFAWETDYATAARRAEAEGKAVLVLMSRPHCPNTYFLCQRVLSLPDIHDRIEQTCVPVLLSIDVLNMAELERRAGRPQLTTAAAKDNDLRFRLKKQLCDEALKTFPSTLPPLIGLLTPQGVVVAASAGLIDDAAFRALLEHGPKPGKSAIASRKAATPMVIRPMPAPEPQWMWHPYEAYRTDSNAMYNFDCPADAWVFTGNGSAGESAGQTDIPTAPDPFIIRGQKFGVGGFVCAFAHANPNKKEKYASGSNEVGEVYVSASSNNHVRGWTTLTNPPALCTWDVVGEGIIYYRPRIGPEVESIDYRCGDTLVTVYACSGASALSIVGCPPAHRRYNGTVRVGRRPMGVRMNLGGSGQRYVFAVCHDDGTIAAVYIDQIDGEKLGDRMGETTYFDAATGRALDRRPASEQIIDSDGRGGGQEGFDKLPGKPGPVSANGVRLGIEDITIWQTGEWGDKKTPDDNSHIYMFVSNHDAGSVSVFDAGPFVRGASKDLLGVTVINGIPNAKKLLFYDRGDDKQLWIGINPGSTVMCVGLDTARGGLSARRPQSVTVGKDPMYMAMGRDFGIAGLLFVCNSGSDSVSVVRDQREFAKLDASNAPPFKRPYGIWISGDSSRMIISNNGDTQATWFNFRIYADKNSPRIQDFLINADRITVGPGVTAIDGDYGP